MYYFMRCFAASCLLVAMSSGSEAEWPAWRGPDGNLVAPAGDYPIEFGPDKNCLWQIDLGGEGSSTPAVWGDAIFLTLTDEGEDVAASYDLAGNERWRVALGPARAGKNRAASGSNPSPVTNGKQVVTYFKSGVVACFDLDGKEQWRSNLQDKYGPDTLWWDLGTSPVLTSAGACIAVMQEGDSYLVTLDLESGNQVWKTKRQYERPKESDQAYTTPSVANIGGRETIVTFGADHLTGHDATTGELLWEQDGFNPQDKGMWRVIASATIADGVVVVPYGRADFLAAIDLEQASAKSEKNAPSLWRKQGIGSDVPSPAIADGKVYLLGDKGDLTCLDLATGDVLAEGKLPKNRNNYFGSPLVAGGNLYCLREDGTMFVVTPGEEFEILAENDLGDTSVATPVPVDGTLLVRTRTKLLRFGNDAK